VCAVEAARRARVAVELADAPVEALRRVVGTEADVVAGRARDAFLRGRSRHSVPGLRRARPHPAQVLVVELEVDGRPALVDDVPARLRRLRPAAPVLARVPRRAGAARRAALRVEAALQASALGHADALAVLARVPRRAGAARGAALRVEAALHASALGDAD